MVSDAGRGPSLPANHPFRVARANPRIPQPPAPSVAQHNRPRGLARHEGSRRRDAGAYSATAGICSPRRPARVSSRALRSSGTSRSGGCLSAPAFGDFGPGPRFGIRHSPAAPHRRFIVGRLIRQSRPSQRTTLLRHARRRSGAKASWTSATNGLLSRRRPLPRQVLDPNAPSWAAAGASCLHQRPRG